MGTDSPAWRKKQFGKLNKRELENGDDSDKSMSISEDSVSDDDNGDDDLKQKLKI